ncbi:crossover junction endonuclease EME1 [Drosophila sulfurigaster albostrigata]|uniref:crossover junction endonuclease EME1 n=1 Tax=Drosophila sulfurigaster albostrigata TaxID=89887 RepID=UPI002D21BF23|nr:crossover junction endonuclease EME1 [Drosophila sulfurigaster albostrigata]XP_062137243.1 crossover junction endonuclease EME1 [Drosophila sulfurigaster albostrigata]XP_062137244.1 crossover junction endonuclease EME1 [Drosophila sulfurigaster albostrigata]XP_062137245.1 crossover junction endonuclease EME1 [Drosophila sulfurigaster albostrigata]
MANKVDKLQKQAIREQQKRIRPGECLKYVRLVLDTGLQQHSLGQELIALLNSTDLKYEIRSLPARNCILWERNVGQQTFAAGSAALDDAWQMEPQLLKIFSKREFQEQQLGCLGVQLHEAFTISNCKFTVIVPRLRGNEANALIELQLLQQLQVEQLPPPHAQELLGLLQRYTKAIAETPYKRQRQAILGSFKKYLANDNKQCVRVEQGHGFGRLWQQHLNRLPLVTLEVAESIIAQYPCPKRLLAHFHNDPKDAIQLLADIKIKRSNGPQPLQSERRIGNVLSTKLHTLYNTRDPNTLI